MRKKLLIAVGVFLAIIVVAIVALSIVLKTYLKSEKLKPILIPRAEEFTGRDVELGRIDVSLFRGVVLKELVIKEGERDFVRVKEFVLSYDLLPLLRKQLVIRKIVLVSPHLRIKRFEDGTYNFSDILARAGGAGEDAGEKAEGGGLPVSLVTERVLIEDARVEFTDEMKDIPDVTARADADVKISLEKELQAEGRLDLKELSAELKGVKTAAKGRLDIKKDVLKADLDISVDGEDMSIEATVKDYATAPDMTFALKAGHVDVEKLMALAGRPGEKKTGEKKTAAAKPGERKPMDIKASGTVDIKSAKYKEYTVTDLHLSADSKIKLASAATGTVNIKEFKAGVNGFDVNAGGTVNLEPESVRASLQTALALPGTFKHGEYTVEGLKLDASPDVTYLLKERKVTAHVPVSELTAAALAAKDVPVKGLRFAGVADAAYGLEDESLRATVKMDELKANVKGADIAARGTVSYDGETISAALKDVTAAAETLTHEDYTIKNLRLAAMTDIKMRLKDKTPTGKVDLKEFSANINGVDTGLRGKINATEKKITADLTAAIDKDEVRLAALATDYRDAPDISFDLYSRRLDLDRLLALAKTEKTVEAPEKPAPKRKSEAKPLKVKAEGKVRVDKADYRGYVINNFSANVSYVNNLMTIDPVSMAIKGGTAMVVNGDFTGNVSFKYPRGSAEAEEVMKQTMSGRGSSKFKKIQIKDVKVADAIARLTGLEELSNPTFTESRFNYVIKDRKVNLEGYMSSERIRFSTLGFVGLDKDIDMEAELWLDRVLTRRLIITKVIRERDDSSTLPLVIKGTTEEPKVNIAAEKVIQKELDKGIQKLFEKVLPQKQEPTAPQEQPPAEEQPTEPIKEIFKGIFGR